MIVFLLIASIALMAASFALSRYSSRRYKHTGLSKAIDLIMSILIIFPSVFVITGIADFDIASAAVLTIALCLASVFRSYRDTITEAIDIWAIGWKSIVLDIVLIVLATIASDIALEMPSNTAVWNMKPIPFLMDIVISLGVIAVPFFVSSGRTLFSKFMSIVMFAIGIAEYAVLQFKDLPIQPGDLFALNTAAAVGANSTSGYALTIGAGCMYGMSVLILAIILLCLTSHDRARIIKINTIDVDEETHNETVPKGNPHDGQETNVETNSTDNAKIDSTDDENDNTVSAENDEKNDEKDGKSDTVVTNEDNIPITDNSATEACGTADINNDTNVRERNGIKTKMLNRLSKAIEEQERNDVESSFKRKRAIGYRIAGWTLLALFIVQFTIPYALTLGITVYTWKPIPSYQDNGFLSSFVSTAQLMIPQKPKGYTKATADATEKELAKQYDEQNGADSAAKAASNQYSQQKPNIVIVMNETFSDLSIYDAVKAAGYDGPQYFKSLYDDSILHGTLQVSAMGGGTCNSEFETLTGNSMAFIGSGVYPYETYNMNIDSLVSQLKKQGYGTHAIHPAAGSNWNRDGVYSAFGFDTFDDEATFTDATRFRNRIDDASTYSKVLNYLDSSDDPQFVFDVTLMGHSGYETGLVPDDKKVNYQVDGLNERNQNKLNEYLATVNEEDNQLKVLIDGIKKSKKPTIVLFFGDHQPAMSDVLGGSSDNIVDTEQKWQTCYTMWANYDVAGSIKGTELDTSTNYLSALLCHSVGIPMTNREKASYILRENITKINVVGVYLAKNSKHDDEWENTDAAFMNSESAKALSYLQYRNLFDTGHGIFSTDSKQANDV